MHLNYRQSQGFILAAVLWAVALMFIVVGIFNYYVQRKLVVATQAKQHIQNVIDGYSTEQTLLYKFATARMTLAGLSVLPVDLADENFSKVSAIGDEVWLDGTAYVGYGGARFSIQDNSGLIALNAQNDAILLSFLERFETNGGIKNRLLATLKDYKDSDDIVGLGGAEQMDYRRAGMPAPANDLLRTPLEINRVLGWRDWLNAHPEIKVDDTFSLRRFASLNFNAIPKHLLMQHFGFAEEVADNIIRERKSNPFRAVDDILQRTGLDLGLDDDMYVFFPSDDLRFKIWSSGGGQAKVISLQLTPNGLMGPWQVDYEYSVQSVENNNEPLALRQSTLFGNSVGDDVRSH